MSTPEPVPVRFTKEEVQAKIGQTVRTLTGFYRVPYGTIGRVIDSYEMGTGFYDVVIQWSLPNAREPVVDRFAKSTYEQLLAEE